MRAREAFFPLFIAGTIAAMTCVCGAYNSSIEAQAAVIQRGAAAAEYVATPAGENQLTSDPVHIDAEVICEEPAAEAPEINEHDLELMTMVLVGECHGFSWEHQLAVGSVVLNRVADTRFPNTIEAVLYQKGQYACFRDGNAYRKPTERNREAARYLLEHGTQIPANVVWQSQRRQGKGLWKKIDCHYFCY